MKIYICNAFSLSMLDRKVQTRSITFRATEGLPRIPFPITDVHGWLLSMIESGATVRGCVGHPDTARLFERILRLDDLYSREAFRLKGGFTDGRECALIGQVTDRNGGPYRLPPGATELPADAHIEWWLI